MDKIHKSGAIIIKNHQILGLKSKNDPFIITPGGKRNSGESAETCLIRELKEELGTTVADKDLILHANYSAPAAGEQNKTLIMTVFRVLNWQGELKPKAEITALYWLDSTNYQSYHLGSIMKEEIIPKLIVAKLIK